MHTWTFEGIGTQWTIDVVSPLSKVKLEFLKKNVANVVADFDTYFSRFIETSFVSTLVKKKGVIEVREDFVAMLLAYLPLYHLTNGQFTPLVGTLLEQTGYDKNYSFKEKKLMDVPAFPEAVEIIDATHIKLNKPVLFDFGAIGKGYLIDMVARIIEQVGCTDYSVDAGGDIVTKSSTGKALSIGLEHPENVKTIIGVVPVKNKAICGSSGNRRAWGRFHHIVNAKTKESPTNVAAAWVIAENAALADALSTCLFFISPQKLLQHYNFEYLVLSNKMVPSASTLFQQALFKD